MLQFDWLRRLNEEYSVGNDSKKIEQNLFGILKSNEMSHDYLERLFWIDGDLHSLFVNLITEKFLDNTLFIVMGELYFSN